MTTLRNLPIHHRSRYSLTRRALAALVVGGILVPLLAAYVLATYADLFTFAA